MDKEFVAPGPGSWALETTHFNAAVPQYGRDLFRSGLERGFAEGSENYGLPMRTLSVDVVNGFFYSRQAMVGEPANPPATPPPGWMMYFLSRLHPGLRQRNKNAVHAIETKIWEKDLAEWDDFYKADSIERNLKLSKVDLPSLDDRPIRQSWNFHYKRTFY